MTPVTNKRIAIAIPSVLVAAAVVAAVGLGFSNVSSAAAGPLAHRDVILAGLENPTGFALGPRAGPYAAEGRLDAQSDDDQGDDDQGGDEGQEPCTPIRLETTDYLLDVTSTLPNYYGLPATIDIHRVRPVYRHGRCSHHFRPAILLHGRTLDMSGFDVQYADYSLMDAMASAGIDSFAFNQLGYGLSSRFGIDDPCNVSNSHDVSLPGHPGNQQSTFLVPNPLANECEHSDHSVFMTSQSAVDQLDQVIQHVQSTTGNARVSLFSWSQGGEVVGGYLAQPGNRQNVANAVFLASVFGSPSQQPPPPYPTWPTGLGDYARLTGVFSINPACAGQRDPNILAPLWAGVRARDPIGAGWGSTDPVTGGVFRWPTAIRWGWGAAEAAMVTVPSMVVSPMEDRIVAPALETSLYEALASEKKVIVRIDCASHPAAWEGSTNPSGWGGPHTTLQDATIEWMSHATYQGETHGAFRAKVDGTVVAE
jgi:pimeloyl-ACP methyl ester carboxylesterase